MPGDRPSNVYRVQLSSLCHGFALWNPHPVKKFYNQVSIGDVGYVNSEGFFYRMFNVTLPSDHPSNNKLGQAEPYEPLDCGKFDSSHEKPFHKGEYYTPNVSSERNIENTFARDPRDAEGITYKCNGPGALLSIPHHGHSEDTIRTKVFGDYICNNVASWFDWSQKNGLDVERMEDLILITGCTLVTSWAAAAFLGRSGAAEVSLIERPHQNGISFEFNTRGDVVRNCSLPDPSNPSPTEDQCVFIRGFRAKRSFFRIKPMRAAAEPLPDDPDNCREDEIDVTRVPDIPKDRDPLVGVLDYILQNCPEGTIAIAHDDDLQLIENVETLTADTVEQFLHENQVPVLIESGAAILRNLRGDAPLIPEEEKGTFFTTAPEVDPSTHSSPTLLDAVVNELPPLPGFRSEQLAQRVFTHSSLTVSRVHPFQVPGDDANPDNEELGRIGDQAFGLAITNLIQDLYPNLQAGFASKLMDKIKHNAVLAKICVSYGWHERLRANLLEHQAHDLKDSASVQVGVFKAYVGGVYMDQGQQAVSKWLNPLFKPRVEAAYQDLRKHHLLTPEAVALLQPSTSGSASPNHVAESPVTTRHEDIPTIFPQENAPSGLPSLPVIKSQQILDQIFTHRSLVRRSKRAFEDSPNDANRDNEQLITLGDRVFGLVMTDLIRDSFPYLSVGPSSKVRDHLKFHGTLAKIAVLYKLHERLLVQAAQANEVRRSAHAQAEVFKAYVGGLYREQGLDVVTRWLRSVFQVDIREAYESVRREHLLPPTST